MKIARIIIGVLSVLLALPITLWLQYKVLRMVNASELMMFLYWVNLPIIILFTTLNKILEKVIQEKK